MLNLQVDTQDCFIVRVKGELDLSTAPELRAELKRLIGEGAKHLLLDLRDVTFIDSSGLVVFIYVRRRLLQKEGSFALINPNAAVKKILSIAGLDQIFETYVAMADASKNFREQIRLGT
jgi:anti-sigma B factor antagonist